MKTRVLATIIIALYAIDAIFLGITLSTLGESNTPLITALGVGASFAIGIGLLIYINVSLIKPVDLVTDYAKKILKSPGGVAAPQRVATGPVYTELVDSIDALRDELKRSKELEHVSAQCKREMVTTINHSVKAPISSIRDIADLLRSRAEPGKERAQLEAICSKSEYVAELLTEMLKSMPEDDDEITVNLKKHSSMDLYDLINNADYDKQCAFIGAIPKSQVVYDEVRMQNVFDHIISNSYKYSGTKITVHSDIVDDQLQIILRDYGGGIAPEEISLVFQKHYRGKNAAGKYGAGLGLYVSAYYMERMHGSVSCENYTGGFGVTISLPLATAAAPEQLKLTR